MINKDCIFTGINFMINRHLEIISRYIDMRSWELTEEENTIFNSSLKALYIYQESIRHINS